MRIRKSPWGRCGSRRWPAWDTLETPAWVPVRCSFRRGPILGLGELRTHGAGSFQAPVWIRPRTSRGGWQPLPLEGEGTSGLRFQMLLGQDNGGPGGVCAGTHSPGRRNPHSLWWAGPRVGQGLVWRRGRLPSALGAGVRAGNAAPWGTGRGYSGPAPAQVANGRGGAG